MAHQHNTAIILSHSEMAHNHFADITIKTRFFFLPLFQKRVISCFIPLALKGRSSSSTLNAIHLSHYETRFMKKDRTGKTCYSKGRAFLESMASACLYFFPTVREGITCLESCRKSVLPLQFAFLSLQGADLGGFSQSFTPGLL